MSAETQAPGIFTVGGKDWRVVVSSSIEHDFHTTAIAKRLGLDSLALEKGETAGAFGLRIFHRAIDTGTAWALLGSLILPAEVADDSWTPAIADKTAAFMRARTDPQDKVAVTGVLASLLIGFFADALRSLKPSDTVSETAAGEGQRENNAAPPSKTLSPGNGPNSSGSSRTLTH